MICWSHLDTFIGGIHHIYDFSKYDPFGSLLWPFMYVLQTEEQLKDHLFIQVFIDLFAGET